MSNQPTATPTRKVTAAGLAGAVTTVAVWAIGAFTGVTVPADVAVAATTILTVGTAYVVKD